MWEEVLTHGVAFILGMPFGALIHHNIRRMMNNKVIKVDKLIAVLVAIVWGITVLIGSVTGQSVDVCNKSYWRDLLQRSFATKVNGETCSTEGQNYQH